MANSSISSGLREEAREAAKEALSKIDDFATAHQNDIIYDRNPKFSCAYQDGYDETLGDLRFLAETEPEAALWDAILWCDRWTCLVGMKKKESREPYAARTWGRIEAACHYIRRVVDGGVLARMVEASERANNSQGGNDVKKRLQTTPSLNEA